MKKVKISLLLTLLILSQKMLAQFTQLELASGISKTDFTSFFIKPIDKELKFSVSTLAFFQKFHEKEYQIYDELGVQKTTFWNYNKHLSIGPSLYHNSVSGFSERISMLFTTKTANFSFTAIPSIAHMESTAFINGELFVQIQLTQPIKNEWEALLSATMLTHWEQFSVHSRSFQQLRIGLSYKTSQFGFATDFDQYGAAPETVISLGLFLRKNFIN